jgi:RNA polymerase sigma factor (sigma-70 family)
MNPSPDLLERCRQDDRKAHHELYVMCFPVMYSVCSRYYVNKDDRMSALNMIFLKLVQGMGSYMKKYAEVPYEQWLRKISVNYIIDEFRKQKRYRELISLYDDTPHDQLQMQEEETMIYDKEELREAINQLPVMSRTVFNLYAIDGYKHEEIATLLGISSGTSKSHVFRARKKLQEVLSEVKKSSWNKSLLQ